MDSAELSPKRRLLILAICCTSLFIVGLDSTIVNVALPSIQRDLHSPVSGLQRTVDAYTLVLASLLILSGSTGDRVGRRLTFQVGLVVFTLGSLLCSMAPGLGWLVAFRVLQAVGGSMLNPVALSIISNTFTDPAERARAIGIWGSVFGVSLAVGPILGGALVEGPRSGWGSAKILGFFGLAAAALTALLWYEPRRDEPLLDLRFFRCVPFSAATVIAVCAFAALSGFLFLNTLCLQEVRGYPAVRAGLFMQPMAAMIVVCAPLSGRIVGARGPRLPLAVAGTAIMISGLALTRLAAGTPMSWVVGCYLGFGIGVGMVNPAITNTAVSSMPRSQAGLAAAIASTSRQVGISLGVAVMGSAVLSALHGPVRSGFAEASHAGWWIVAGCGATTLLAGIISTSRWANATAKRTASLLRPGREQVPVRRGGAYRTWKTASKMRVTMADTAREPRQPRRLEKNKNMAISHFCWLWR